MATLRPLTLAESVRLVVLAGLVRRNVDAELGELLYRVAGGDDSVLPACYDRLHVIGRPELADRLRDLMLRD